MSPSSTPAHDAVRQALQLSLRPPVPAALAKPRLLVAGATGVLGNEVVRLLVGSSRFAHTEVLATAAMTSGLPGVGIVLTGAPSSSPRDWPVRPLPAHTGLVMFEPPRLYYGRERTLWTPLPEQLPALAEWFRRCGVQTLVVVMPHAPGRLPEALKHGLANLDEQAVAALGFERLLLVRSARQADDAAPRGFLEKTAAWMLSTLKYMIPATEQPVRPTRLAEFVEAVLRVLPPGTHVVPPELLWQAGQLVTSGQGQHRVGKAAPTLQSLIQAWLDTGHNPKENPPQGPRADSAPLFVDRTC